LASYSGNIHTYKKNTTMTTPNTKSQNNGQYFLLNSFGHRDINYGKPDAANYMKRQEVQKQHRNARSSTSKYRHYMIWPKMWATVIDTTSLQHQHKKNF